LKPGGTAAAIVLLCLTICLASCGTDDAESPDVQGDADAAEPVTITTPDLLGTIIRADAYGVQQSVLAQAMEIVRGIDARMSVNKPDSEISKINAAAGQSGVKVSEETYSLIEGSIALSNETDGTFDPALGGVTTLWKVDGSFGRLPESAEIDAALPGAGSANVALEGGGVVKLTDERTGLDLGGIAKGYACEAAAEFLQESGSTSALLDFGGNIFAFGRKPDGSEWTVGVRAPYPGDGGIACALPIDGKAVVTSGYYEKYFEDGGMLYHHIIDPATGYPSDSGLLSATIVADSATKADALSTACFVLGLDRGMKLLAETDGCEGIFITGDESAGVIRVTPGLKGRVRVKDGRFTLEEA
jgi:thiamine biosynthesis lipoprotein